MVNDRHFKPSPWVLRMLVAALVFFLLAAVLAIVVNAPTESYVEADTRDLLRLTQAQFWDASWSIGSRRAAEVRVAIIQAARITNTTKATELLVAGISEIVGIAFLATAVWIILT